MPDLHLATAELSGKWDSDDPKYRLKFILACGPEILKGGNRQYEANLKQCLIMLYTDGCTADFSDAYSYALPFKWKVTESDYSKISRTKEGEFGIDGIAVAKPSRRSRIIGKIRFLASRKEKSGAKFDRTAKFEQLVRLISYRGKYWAVGDDHYGDPRYMGRWLRERYFQENPTKPLCKVDLHDGCENATVRIEVWARPGQISIRELSASDWPEDEARLGRRNDALKILEMKAVFRGMATAKVRPSTFYAQLPLIDAKGPSELIPLDRTMHPVQPLSI